MQRRPILWLAYVSFYLDKAHRMIFYHLLFFNCIFYHAICFVLFWGRNCLQGGIRYECEEIDFLLHDMMTVIVFLLVVLFQGEYASVII